MTTTRVLQREAEIRARAMGHELGEWEIVTLTHDRAVCKNCHRSAYVRPVSAVSPYLYGFAMNSVCPYK